MMEKTLEKLLKKESKKPLHCIDTSVFLESTLETKIGDICKSHLNNMGKGKYFRGVMPMSVLGEISMVVFRDIKNSDESAAKFDLLEKFVKLRSIDFVAAKKEDYQLIDKLIENERIEPTDAQHLVCAKRAGANVFITLDAELIDNKNLENVLGLKIQHPSGFVNI